MIDPTAADSFLRDFDRRIAEVLDPAPMAMRMIAERFPHYRWVGIYWLRGDELVLGPYVGEATEHVRIPVGQGVCGTAVALGKNQIVADVRELTNYLACSLKTRSEIVVLLRRGDRILGQIDADGHETGAFDETDESFLTAVGERLAAGCDA
jgi:L-methionine (R)-S-oxide reductase